MSLLLYLSYAAVVVAFAFITLSLASGLLYISELIEEHSRLSKSIGQRGIYVILLLHAILYFTESLPLTHTAFSFFCHLVYLQNFSSSWPLISLTSISFIASCVLVIADHFLWFFYFAKLSQDARIAARRPYGVAHVKSPPAFVEIATFFGICVWLAPLFLFLSLSANDNSLPVQSADANAVHTSTKSRVSLFRSLISIFWPSRDPTEGIIAPRSPGFTPTSPGYAPMSPGAYDTAFGINPGPPRSPRQSIHLSPEFSLSTPPPRRATSPAIGLGLRRATGGSPHKTE